MGLLRGFAIFLGVIGLFALTVELYSRSRAKTRQQHLERVAEQALLGGGLQGLLRARAMALGSSAMAGDPESAATLALANAMLASEYGMDEANPALTAAQIVEMNEDASRRAQALKLASRALVELTKGHPDQAEAWARQSVDMGHKQASPLFALGRVRFHQGNMVAASNAFQAALVREPSFVEARVAWAEVWLEQGDRTKARDALRAVLQRTPDHSRAQLLLTELHFAAGEDLHTDTDWESACTRDEAASPAIMDMCSLARAHQAWRRHDYNAAVSMAEEVGRRPSIKPRMIGGAAQLLACAGLVDRAATLLNTIAPKTEPMPSLRWARIAIQLGRGHLVDFPADLAVEASPWAPVLAARVALAMGGAKALKAPLPDLMGARTDDDKPDSFDPVRAYVQGMRARLAGNPALAMDLLGKSLARHGDACRAAGEYLALAEAAGGTPDSGTFAWLVDNNSQCVNLPAAYAAVDGKTQSKAAQKAARRRR